jgi:hypothetical protein
MCSDIFKQNDPHVDALGCGALLVQCVCRASPHGSPDVQLAALTARTALTHRQVGDCHSERCLKEWYPHANNITLSKYAFELQEIFEYSKVKARFPEFQLGVFGHSPDTVRLASLLARCRRRRFRGR